MTQSPTPTPSSNPLAARLRSFFIFAGGLALLFILPLWELVRFVAAADYYSYVLLIPVITVYLISLKKKEIPPCPSTSPGTAAILVVIGIGALMVGFTLRNPTHPGDRHSVMMLAFLAFLFAGGFLFLGARVLRSITFPAAFLLLAIPLPRAVMEQIQIGLQHASAEAAYWMMRIADVPMLRDGIDFQLPGIPIRVAEECSGFNSSFVLFIISLVASHLFFKSPYKKLALVLAVIPLAIIRNGLRITTISLLCVHVGPEMINSSIHRRGGPIFFALSMIPFGALIWFLRRGETTKVSAKTATVPTPICKS